MIITLKLNIAKEIFKSNKTLFHGIDWKTERRLATPTEAIDSIEVFKIDIEKHTKQEIQKLRIKLSGIVPRVTIEKIDRYLEAMDNPDANVLKEVETFKKALDKYISELSIRWFWKMGQDEVMLPYAIRKTQIVPASKHNPKYIKLTLVTGTLKSGEDISHAETHIGFYSLDMYERTKEDEEIDDGAYFEYSDAELVNAEEDEEGNIVTKKKKKANVKRKYLNLRDILFKKGIFFNSDELQNIYIEHYELWKKTQLECIGHQYTCDELGFSNIKSEWSNYSSNRVTSFIEDKTRQKLVVDEFILKNKDKGMPITIDTSFGISYLPYHFYVNLYNITKHTYCQIHIGVLDKYKYNKTLLEKLIVHPNVKALINAMIDGELEMEGKDIIEGKSGGLTILGFGPPGNGKTLTGEIYSEYIEKPLYQIQSSQLGINVQDIEKNLHAVLRRAERWGCILMIDEADTYIYKRGQDILQNCIVGTFLRLLEYYNGILFLTTNRADIIDEAIMSRVTVSIPYKNPQHDDLVKIWETHTPSYSLNIPQVNIGQIATKFPMSGRDVRNCLKLLSRYYKDGEPITVEKIEAIKDYLPSITV